MSVTVMALLSVNENEPRALAEYLDVTAPLLERAGANKSSSMWVWVSVKF